MIWNWQRKDWPNFTFDAAALDNYEKEFFLKAGRFSGAFEHLNKKEQMHLTIELISDEAVKTSEIEGEILSRDSVQSSVRKQLGLQQSNTGRARADKSSPQEQAIAEMMVNLFRTYDEPLSRKMLFNWHKMLMQNEKLSDIGRYRTHADSMQVVSGYVHKRKVHFEAPPSHKVPLEMKNYIKWFCSNSQLSILARAGIAHLYFVSIHPFEDGNGRIARALSVKALSGGLGQPSLIGLSQAIQSNRKKYYAALEQANKQNDVTDWLVYFSETILKAQELTEGLIKFVIAKTKLLDRVAILLNTRQQKVVLTLFKFGPSGFKTGLSAEKYISITKTSRATATRDLQELVDLGVLSKTGELKHTRYWLRLG
ncbi:MAG: Fic family protein [Bdellovibrionota bacterium]